MNFFPKNILVYNENWEYQRTITLPNAEYPINGPTYSININGVINITSTNVINNFNKYVNLTKQANSTVVWRGIYYNPSNQLLYVSAGSSNIIKIFDQN